MKLLSAILLTSLGTLSAQDTPETFQKADKAYNAAKVAMSERHSGKTTQEKFQLFQTAKELFQQFITANPDHPEVATAYYRSGVSDLLTGKRASAEEAFRNTLKSSNQKGQRAASAAFRLGALAYNDDKFADAARHFNISKNETDKPFLKAKSLNYLARCYLQTKQTDKAQTALEELVALDHEDNSIIPQAKLALGQIHQAKGELDQAHRYYLELAKAPKPAIVKPKIHLLLTGVWGLELANELAKENSKDADSVRNSSIQLLQQSLETEGSEEGKLWAQFSLMDSFANQNEHNQVLETFNKGRFRNITPNPLIYPQEPPQDLEAKVLLLAANSSYQETQFESARTLCHEVAAATEDKTLLSKATEIKAKAEEEL